MRKIFRSSFLRAALLAGALPAVILPGVRAQNEYDPLYWSVDSALEARLDTVSRETVTREVAARLSYILATTSGEAAYLPIDTINAWNGVIRQAVILGIPAFGKPLEAIAAAAPEGSRGHWQHYWVYMSLWGAVRLSAHGLSDHEKAVFYLTKLDSAPPDQQIFYEDRLLDLGSAALPAAIAHARTTVVPRLQQPDREMLSEEDLIPYGAYYLFLDLVGGMVKTGADRDLFRELLKEPGGDMRRFAREVLDIVP